MYARRTLLILLILLLLTPTSLLAQDEGGGGGGEDGGMFGTDYTPVSKIARIRGLDNKTSTNATYRVRSGDTLWDITERFFKNPYLWPALWSYNPHITNPHWIYPDDVIFLRPPAEAEEAQAAELLGVTREAGLMVLLAGFYTSAEIEDAPKILFSPEEKTMITLTDEVYIDFPLEEQLDALARGQRFAIMKIVGSIKNDDNEVIANKLRLVGTTEIIYFDDETLPTGRIVDAYHEIERGDMLFAYDKQLVRVLDKVSRQELDASIIDTMEIATIVGEQQFVFINRGSDDGVEVGNKFLAFEQRDGLLDLPNRVDANDDETPRDNLPRRLIGEILVVRVTSEYTTGLIINSLREMDVGQPLIMFDTRRR